MPLEPLEISPGQQVVVSSADRERVNQTALLQFAETTKSASTEKGNDDSIKQLADAISSLPLKVDGIRQQYKSLIQFAVEEIGSNASLLLQKAKNINELAELTNLLEWFMMKITNVVHASRFR